MACSWADLGEEEDNGDNVDQIIDGTAAAKGKYTYMVLIKKKKLGFQISILIYLFVLCGPFLLNYASGSFLRL